MGVGCPILYGSPHTACMVVCGTLAHDRARSESRQPDDFVALAPDSGDFFLGKTLSEAIQASDGASESHAVRPSRRTPSGRRVRHGNDMKGDGQLGLLGVGLLKNRRLEIDYRSRVLSLD